jgi:type IV secretion system protein VirB10
MTEQIPNTPATIPEQPEAKLPLKKGMPVVIALVAILARISHEPVVDCGDSG